MSAKDKTVLVTGGAKRLGRAIALEMARGGANVAISYNTSRDEAQQTLEELRALAPGGIIWRSRQI
jgi:NAD(P)-dependent dehydrogenase (short-subunit alcohol dehydrogenase family)